MRISACLVALLAALLRVHATRSDCVRSIHSDVPSSAILQSPGFPSPYQTGVDCLYNITTTHANVIHITFLTFDIAEPNASTGQCLDAYLVIVVVDRQGKEHVGPRMCGRSLPKKLETMQPGVRIEFVASVSTEAHRGFRLQYDILSEAAIREPRSQMSSDEIAVLGQCGGRSRPGELTGEITSPGFPETYPRNCSCNWLIRVEPRQRIYVRLVHLNLTKTIAECERASLSIIDGYKHEVQGERKDIFGDGSEARFCGTQQYYAEEGMRTYMSSGNRLLVRFITTDRPPDSLDGFRVGFKVVWTAVESLVGEVTPDGVVAKDQCDQFVCRGGQLCIDQGQGVCPSKTQLCIHSSLVCNGINNCVEGDYSDEQHCYSREILFAAATGLAAIIVTIGVCVCCDQWKKRRRLRYLIREQRQQNGKTSALPPKARLPPRPPR